MLKAINAINSLLGMLLSLILVAALAVGGWFAVKTYLSAEWERQSMKTQLAKQEAEVADLNQKLKARQEEIDGLNKDLEAKRREIQRLETAVRLLKVDHRVAQIDVLSQEGSAKDGNLLTKFSFVELGPEGKPLETPRAFSVKGDMVHLDALVVKFNDKSVEEADPLRSTSVCLFQTLYGDAQQPKDGFVLDPVGDRPAAYRSGKPMSDLEREIWAQFWEYANDAAKAKQAGIRAAHGQGIYQKMLPGKRYKVLLRASDGLTAIPEDLPKSGPVY